MLYSVQVLYYMDFRQIDVILCTSFILHELQTKGRFVWPYY